MKNLSLKNLKFHEDMSEETPCFSAELYDNGKLVAHVKNNGRGGSNTYYLPNGAPKTNLYEKYGDLDTDCHIMELAEELNIVKKLQSNNFVLKKDNKVYTVKNKLSFAKLKTVIHNYEHWLTTMVKKYEKDGYMVLNTNI